MVAMFYYTTDSVNLWIALAQRVIRAPIPRALPHKYFHAFPI